MCPCMKAIELFYRVALFITKFCAVFAPFRVAIKAKYIDYLNETCRRVSFLPSEINVTQSSVTQGFD